MLDHVCWGHIKEIRVYFGQLDCLETASSADSKAMVIFRIAHLRKMRKRDQKYHSRYLYLCEICNEEFFTENKMSGIETGNFIIMKVEFHNTHTHTRRIPIVILVA